MPEFMHFINEERLHARLEAFEEAVKAIENLPCKCKAGNDYCDGNTDAAEAIEALVR
jgi:hypothetical protein